MPRPFGVWAPATTMAEFKARLPRMRDFGFKTVQEGKRMVFYSPEAMAHFKDPQMYKDAVDTLRKMSRSEEFFGYGFKVGSYWGLKLFGCWAILMTGVASFVKWWFAVRTPANNSTWRKVMNKEWEEAYNNSPWDHRTHVWRYNNVYAGVAGNTLDRGQRKFYIPA